MSFKEWKKYKLGEIAKVQTGPFGSQLHVSDYTLEGVPVVMPVNISNEKILTEKIMRVSQETANNLSKHKLNEGDIVFSRRGDVERHAFVHLNNKGWLCGTGCLKLSFKKENSSRFISYQLMLSEKKKWLTNHAVGTTMPNLNTSILSSLEVELPEIKIQQRIASILSSLDEKIELNRLINQTLEAIAQTLFKEMCVPKSEELPEGWLIKPLDDVANFLNGLALQKFPSSDDKYYLPVIKIREIKNGITPSSDKASYDVPSKYIIDNGDLLFSWSATLEVIFWCGGKGALNQHLFKVTSNKYPLWFCYMLINFHLDSFRRIASDKTTTMGHIQRRHLTEALCFIPSNLIEIDKLISPIIDQIKNNNYEIQTLIKFRDSLLPKLMKGEIILK